MRTRKLNFLRQYSRQLSIFSILIIVTSQIKLRPWHLIPVENCRHFMRAFALFWFDIGTNIMRITDCDPNIFVDNFFH